MWIEFGAYLVSRNARRPHPTLNPDSVLPLFFYCRYSAMKIYPLSQASQSEMIAVGHQSHISVLMRVWPGVHPAVGRLQLELRMGREGGVGDGGQN